MQQRFRSQPSVDSFLPLCRSCAKLHETCRYFTTNSQGNATIRGMNIQSCFPHSACIYIVRYTSNQIKSKSIFVYLMEKVPRLSQTQRWFTEYYSVDSVTATDMRNLNKVKKILSFEFSRYGSGDKVSIVVFRE